MAFLNRQFKEHVASLCGTLIGETKPKPMGTCSFVQATNSTGRTFDYLITAKHVFEDMRNAGGPAYVRINKGRTGEYDKGIIDVPIPLKAGWLLHPDESVDLAVLPKEIIRSPHELSELIEMEPHLAELDKIDTYRSLLLKLDTLVSAPSRGFAWPPLEGESVMFIAMTTQFQGEKANLPTVRMGHLALVTDEPIKGAYGRSQYYVIEAQVYPGNSGAPVWVELVDKERQGGWFTLGVVVYSYPALEELKKVPGRDEAYYNMGLSLVVPIEKVIEIVNSPEEKARRETIAGAHEQGTPISAGDDDQPFVLNRADFQEALLKVSRPNGKAVIEKLDEA